jgi:hypothetical protein
MTPLQFTGTKAEPEIAELYCQPRAYYHSVEFIEKEALRGLFTFDDLNKPEKWLKAVSKYLALTGQDAISPAAKQLYRLVEEARETQDRAWGDRKVTERTPESYERRERAAWEKFNRTKQQCLRRYERALATGEVKRIKRKRARICPRCEQEPLLARQRACDNCRKAARRERNSRFYGSSKESIKTPSPLGISPQKGAIPQWGRGNPFKTPSGHARHLDLRLGSGDGKTLNCRKTLV